MSEEKPSLLSLEPAAFEIGATEEECDLLGNRCPQCDLFFFPQRHFCARCCGSGLEIVRLSRKGSLRSFTTVYQKPRYAEVEPPYLMGEIELPEGVLVYSLLTCCSASRLKIGSEMKLAAIKVREELQGGKPVAVLAYSFTPC